MMKIILIVKNVNTMIMMWELKRFIYYDVEDNNNPIGKVLKGYLNIGVPSERCRK